jgi:hypothetical protein
MADLRCPNCGRDNPDFLDNCQFCQSPLNAESTLHTGDTPIKRNTGELEPILPQWLKDVRQQARESAEQDAAASAAQPKIQKEPPDLLAGLASQSRNDEEEIPDWLASINPAAKPKPIESKKAEPQDDFFSQFNRSEPKPAEPVITESEPEEEVPAWMAGMAEPQPPKEKSEEKDELSEWFSQAAAEPEQVVEIDNETPAWMSQSDEPVYRIKESEAPKEQEDLDWLRSLEASSEKPAVPASPSLDSTQEAGSDPSQVTAGGEDLSWLNELGGIAASMPAEPAPLKPVEPESFKSSQPSEPQGELSWLDQLGVADTSTSQEPAPAEEASQEQPDWMNLVSEQATPSGEKPAENDLSWLQALDEKASAEASPEQSLPFEPRRTGPLGGEQQEESMPDWLKSATEEPSMPAPGALSEWFRESSANAEDETLLSKSRRVSVDPDFFAASTESSSLSSQDVDSLLSADMPDWLSSTEAPAEEKSAQPMAGFDDSLAPGELPAWVQAMRPVESVIAEAPSLESQPTEKEGPLAGLRGIIPAAPIGSALRPRPISLKLQASDEQQAGAVLLEQILAGEVNPKPLATTDFIASQRVLRWALSGLFIIVLSAMIFLGTQSMPVSAALPVHVSSVSRAVSGIPLNSPVLVVVDYEPALAGELEAVSGPLFDQMASLSRPRLYFLSTSPNSSALVERLLRNTTLSLPAPGLEYKAGTDYVNLGYLPGGASGVLEFVESPVAAIPSAGISSISEYAAIILLTDHSESARAWVEQLDARRQVDLGLTSKPLLVAASAQTGPMLQPYVSSQQITGMISGLSDAARYEFVNNSRPGTARRYWDSFGVGLLMAAIIITVGSVWSLVAGIRARRAEAELS